MLKTLAERGLRYDYYFSDCSCFPERIMVTFELQTAYRNVDSILIILTAAVGSF